jgi:hypothetical protein
MTFVFPHSQEQILKVLDDGADAYVFPMLDNGYVYLAASRLSAFRSDSDWALVFEIFGFSPREGHPSLALVTFSNSLPNGDMQFVAPIHNNTWVDAQNGELVAANPPAVLIRQQPVEIPQPHEFANHDIDLTDKKRISIFELARFLAKDHRSALLATDQEQRVQLNSDMKKLIQLEEWNHPDVIHESIRPSGNETFQQLAQVLVTGNISHYRPTLKPNTHWKNWPGGGSL